MSRASARAGIGEPAVPHLFLDGKEEFLCPIILFAPQQGKYRAEGDTVLRRLVHGHL